MVAWGVGDIRWFVLTLCVLACGYAVVRVWSVGAVWVRAVMGLRVVG